jgi:hypothetical protein
MEKFRFKPACERGAASVEGVIVLPVFVILFVGLFFVRALTQSRLDADREARRCAWEYSANSCEAIPAGCDDVLKGVQRGNLDKGLNDTLPQIENSLKSGSGAAQAVKDVVTHMVTGAIAQMLTRSLDSKKTRELERPGLFGGGKSVVVGKYRLACNIPAQGSKDIATAAWKQFRP